MKCDVSIIVLCYMHRRYLDECLDSLIQNIEELGELRVKIVFVDDGSVDGSLEFAKKKLAGKRTLFLQMDRSSDIEKDPMHRVLMALREGLRHVKAEYMFFTEGDDFWVAPNTLQAMISRLSSYKKSAIACQTKNYFSDSKQFSAKSMCLDFGQRIGIEQIIHQGPDLLSLNAILAPVDCWKKAIDDAIKFNTGSHTLALITIADQCSGITLIKDGLAAYRINSASSIMNAINHDFKRLTRHSLGQINLYLFIFKNYGRSWTIKLRILLKIFKIIKTFARKSVTNFNLWI